MTVRDTTLPVLTLPANFTAPGTGSAGATVTYTASATDIVDGTVPSRTPSSGSTFPIGTTTVTCASTDRAGNSRLGQLHRPVSPPAPPPGSPIVINPGNQTNYLGDVVDFAIDAVDPDGDALLFVPVGANLGPDRLAVPTLSISRNSGVIHGTLTQAGSFTADFGVSNGHGHSVRVTFTWTVMTIDGPRFRLSPVSPAWPAFRTAVSRYRPQRNPRKDR